MPILGMIIIAVAWCAIELCFSPFFSLSLPFRFRDPSNFLHFSYTIYNTRYQLFGIITITENWTIWLDRWNSLWKNIYIRMYVSNSAKWTAPVRSTDWWTERRGLCQTTKRQNDDVETWGTRSGKMWCARIAIDMCKNRRASFSIKYSNSTE